MNRLSDRIGAGEVVLIDGGTGTEIERRGGAMNADAWSSEALLTDPDLVRRVHEDFIRAGAEVVIANTFSTARHLLEPASLVERFEELNRLAVTLAREARGRAAPRRGVTVAGSISTTTMGRAQPAPSVARRNFSDQAAIIADAGAELIILEMMRDVEYTTIAVEAASETGLPVWVGFSSERTTDGATILVDGRTPLSEAVAALDADRVALVAIMHTLTEEIDDALDVIQTEWSGPVGAYAHSGVFEMPHWRFVDTISAEDYADHALRWVERGVRVIGGCCGIGPAHIAVLRERLDRRHT